MNNYAMAIVLDAKKANVLMITNNTGPYAGLLNGIGGKVERFEAANAAMWRELQEETGILSGDVQFFSHLVTCAFTDVTLAVFVVLLVADADPSLGETDEGYIQWVPRHRLIEHDTDLAGDGNIPYFVNLARTKVAAL